MQVKQLKLPDYIETLEELGRLDFSDTAILNPIFELTNRDTSAASEELLLRTVPGPWQIYRWHLWLDDRNEHWLGSQDPDLDDLLSLEGIEVLAMVHQAFLEHLRLCMPFVQKRHEWQNSISKLELSTHNFDSERRDKILAQRHFNFEPTFPPHLYVLEHEQRGAVILLEGSLAEEEHSAI